jgi:hypothetical protein
MNYSIKFETRKGIVTIPVAQVMNIFPYTGSPLVYPKPDEKPLGILLRNGKAYFSTGPILFVEEKP